MSSNLVLIENENTFLSALRDGINLFLGAGFSVLAKNENGSSLPIGEKLKNLLLDEFNMQELAALELPQLTAVIDSEHAQALHNFFVKQYAVSAYDSLYNCLKDVNVSSIITTNIDNLIHSIYENSIKNYIVDITKRGASFSGKAAIDYVPLHGCILNHNDKLIFSSTELAIAFSEDSDKWHFLTNKLQSHPTLFWGYQLADPGTLKAINPTTIKNRAHSEKWICIRENDAAKERYYRSIGFNLIIGNTEALLEYLKAAVETFENHLADPIGDLPADFPFPEFRVPVEGKVPMRPLKDFYMGGAPHWSDIHSQQIGKTSQYSKLVNHLNSKSNVIVLGIPASGKTTLMLQAAFEYSSKAQKLVCSSISVEQAALLLKHIHKPTLIFIDDFADSLDAVNILSKCTMVQLVCFDRDNNYEVASHKIDYKHDIINITDLTQKDMQDIYRALPASLRKPEFHSPRLSGNRSPSLFEFLEENLNEPKLKERYTSMLKKLAQTNVTMHDYLVMSAYVHTCRTPVSFDMAYAFLRGDIVDYRELYEVTDSMQSLVPEYSGSLASAEQDYFMPRSNIVSEALVSAVQSVPFRRVLERFHRNVSPYRICRYDIFQRRAYTAEVFRHAFPVFDDGIEWYNLIHARDKNFYIMQQAALYSLSKQQHEEAFRLIDRALLDSGSRVLSIRNSHAIILFEANHPFAISGDVEAREYLERAIMILADCYMNDARKLYHVSKYAEFSLKYWDLYGDEQAHAYLVNALEWLTEESRTTKWNRHIPNLIRRIQRIIS